MAFDENKQISKEVTQEAERQMTDQQTQSADRLLARAFLVVKPGPAGEREFFRKYGATHDEVPNSD